MGVCGSGVSGYLDFFHILPSMVSISTPHIHHVQPNSGGYRGSSFLQLLGPSKSVAIVTLKVWQVSDKQKGP